MNGTASDASEPGWSRTRWVVVFLVLLALHSGLLRGLARWPRLHAVPGAGRSTSRLDISSPAAGLRDPLGSDPRQFAGRDPRGFSGAADRALPPPEYTLAEWPGRPRWLGAENQPERVGSAAPPAAPAPVRPWRAPPVLLSREPAAPLLLATNTLVFPRGDLAGRAIQAPAPPRTLPGSEVLSPTVVEVGVSPVGDVVIARVTGVSGNPEADRIAFAWAQGVRFPDLVPDAENDIQIGRLTWGELAFVWRVQPLSP